MYAEKASEDAPAAVILSAWFCSDFRFNACCVAVFCPDVVTLTGGAYDEDGSPPLGVAGSTGKEDCTGADSFVSMPSEYNIGIAAARLFK